MYLRAISEEKDFIVYDKLVEEQGTVFNSRNWLRLFEPIEFIGIYDEGDHLIGAFNLCVTKVKTIKTVANPPFSPTVGPFYKTEAEKGMKKQAFQKKVVSLMAEYLKARKERLIVLKLGQNIGDTQPFIWNDFSVSPHYTYKIDLSKSEEAIWEAMGERRKNIKKAMKDGLLPEVCSADKSDVTAFTKGLKDNGAKIKTSVMEKILCDFSTSENSILVRVSDRDSVLARVFCVFDAFNCYLIMSTANETKEHSGAAALAIWECMKEAKRRGVQHFDFEGSMIPEIEKFYREFGGELVSFFKMQRKTILNSFL